MIDSIAPYAAVPGFSLAADIREVAAHYGLRARVLKNSDGRKSEAVACARDALFWKLIHQRELSPQRAADLMRTTAKTAREGAARHVHRQQEYAAQFRKEPADA